MKKFALSIVVVLVAAVLIFILIERACDEGPTDDELSRTKRLYEEYKAEVKKEEQEWKKERVRLEREIKGLENEADEWKAESWKYKGTVIARDKEIKDLKGVYPTLQDKDEKIKNLLAQNILLTASLDEAKQGWAAEEQGNLRLRGIIDTKDIIILKLERQLENKDALLKLSEELVATQDRKIKSLKLGRTLSQVLAIGGVSVALWQTLAN